MSLTEALGHGPEISFRGKIYRLAPMDQLNVRSRFSVYLRGQAILRVMELRTEIDAFSVDQMLGVITQNFASGLYEFGQQVVRDSLKVEANQKRLVLYMLQENHPEVDPVLVDDMFKTSLDQVMAAVWSEGAPKQSPKQDGASTTS